MSVRSVQRAASCYAPVPGTYMSVSCFALNTDNYYVKNDQQVGRSFDFVLVGPGRRPRRHPAATSSDPPRPPAALSSATSSVMEVPKNRSNASGEKSCLFAADKKAKACAGASGRHGCKNS